MPRQSSWNGLGSPNPKCKCPAGKCYNCLNGAHGLCPTCSQPNDKQIGTQLVFKSKRKKKHGKAS